MMMMTTARTMTVMMSRTRLPMWTRSTIIPHMLLPLAASSSSSSHPLLLPLQSLSYHSTASHRSSSLLSRLSELDMQQRFYMEDDIAYYNDRYFPIFKSPVKVVYEPFWLPDRGRTVVTTRYVRGGEVVLRSYPYMSVVSHRESDKRCHHCHESIRPTKEHAESPHTCHECKEVHFCSETCMQSYDHFKEECTVMRAMHKLTERKQFFVAQLERGDPRRDITGIVDEYMTTVRMVLKLLAMKAHEQKHFNSSSSSSSSSSSTTAATTMDRGMVTGPDGINLSYEDAFRLYSARKRITNEDYKAFILEAQQLVSEVLRNTRQSQLEHVADEAEIIDLICKQKVNAIHIHDRSTEENVVSGIFPVLSLVNHSCTPNCILRQSADDGMELVALHDIPAGTEINFAYMELNSSNRRRKKLLRENFFFECKCTEVHDKNCNQRFLDKYECPHCHKGLLVPTEPGSKEKMCLSCEHTQPKLQEATTPTTEESQ